MKKQVYRAVFGLMTVLSLAFSSNLTAQVPQKADKGTSYIISDGSRFVPKAYYPKFSWNTTPMYYHFQDIDRVLTPEEVKFIAERTNFITIAKSHAYKMLGDAVLGAKHEATAFHEIKPSIKVLYYFNSSIAWPYTRFNKDFTPDRINEHPRLKKFLVIKPKTGELSYMKPMAAENSMLRQVYYFDYLNPDFRKWWVQSVVEGVKISGSNGVFIDRMTRGRDSTVAKAKGEMMAALRKKLPGKIIIGNNAADNKDAFPSCDAFMFEHVAAATKERLLKEWGDMLRIAKAGKMSVFSIGVNDKEMRLDGGGGETEAEGKEALSKRWVDFYLACYLIGAQPYSYFQYRWGWMLSDGDLVNYPELLKPVGSPEGPYKRVTPEGWVFTREFEHARVWVDTEKREAKITWR